MVLRLGISMLVALSGVGMLPAPPVFAQAAASQPAIERFYRVAEGLYRGAQPDRKGFEDLKRMQVKTVVTLRLENDEKPIVESLGMSYVHIPLDSSKQVPEQAIEAFFEVLRDDGRYPVFVHCQRGADRTGLMIGFYRIAFERWNADRAYDEARALGMSWWRRGLKRQLFDFEEKQAAAKGKVLARPLTGLGDCRTARN